MSYAYHAFDAEMETVGKPITARGQQNDKF